MAEGLDETDRRILGELTRDGRLSMRALAETLHISRPNAYARVERLTTSGVLRGYAADVDHEAAGWTTSAYVSLRVAQVHWREIRAGLQALPGVAHIALVGGDFDVMLLVRARDNAGLRHLVLEQIQGLPGVQSTRTYLVFEETRPAAPLL